MKDAWCLATSHDQKPAAEIVKLYGKRFTIEENFRDTKNLRFGMGLSETRVDSTERRDRLLLLRALATVLLTLLGTALTPAIGAWQYHTDGKLYRSPGWGVSSNDGSVGNFVGEIFAQELVANGRIRRLLHHRTSLALESASNVWECVYDHCPFAVASADGKRVFYDSDWGNSSGSVHGYIGDVRNVCP
jgi:hypothetical protein